ncbi:MAG TPA: outer membrane protein transport protein [Gemmatimonadaceae bacterium]|nr:outer membrane protein transport protein [Gemmatimonadaceae bacterium]
MQRHRLIRYLAVTGSILAALPAGASAQAFGINEIGTCAASRAFAVTGSPCQDASSIFWNPGMLPSQKGFHILGGAAIIQIGGSFTQDTTFQKFEGDVPTAFVPHLFLAYRGENSKLAYGVGVYAPYGLTSQWTDDFPGRFQAQKASLATIYVQPNISYAINDKWSVGGGPILGHSTVELIQALDLSEQVAATAPAVVRFSQFGIPARTEFARANLNGSANSFGGHIGLFGKPNADWTVGVRFLTPLEFEYSGAEATFSQTMTGRVLPPGNPICVGSGGAHPICGGNPQAPVDIDVLLASQFTTGGALVTQEVETRITHPAQVQGGFGYSGFPNWLVSADYAWTGWRRFKELPVTFLGAASGSNRVLIEDYNNTSAIRLGAQRTFTGGAELRLGFSGVASAAPDVTVTPLLPEQDRAYGSIGGAYPITNALTIEGAFLKVFAGGARGRIVERSSRTQTAAQLNTGVYELDANVFSFSLKAIF